MGLSKTDVPDIAALLVKNGYFEVPQKQKITTRLKILNITARGFCNMKLCEKKPRAKPARHSQLFILARRPYCQ